MSFRLWPCRVITLRTNKGYKCEKAFHTDRLSSPPTNHVAAHNVWRLIGRRPRAAVTVLTRESLRICTQFPFLPAHCQWPPASSAKHSTTSPEPPSPLIPPVSADRRRAPGAGVSSWHPTTVCTRISSWATGTTSTPTCSPTSNPASTDGVCCNEKSKMTISPF